MARELSVNGHHIFEEAMLGALLHHHDLAVFFDDGCFNFADFFVEQNFVGQLAVENLLTNFWDTFRAQRIRRARPAKRRLGLFVGLEQRLSDHLGLGEGLGLMRLRRSKTAQTPLAPMVTAFSTYLIGLCIVSSVLSGWWPVASLRRWPRLQRCRRFADG